MPALSAAFSSNSRFLWFLFQSQYTSAAVHKPATVQMTRGGLKRACDSYFSATTIKVPFPRSYLAPVDGP